MSKMNAKKKAQGSYKIRENNGKISFTMLGDDIAYATFTAMTPENAREMADKLLFVADVIQNRKRDNIPGTKRDWLLYVGSLYGMLAYSVLSILSIIVSIFIGMAINAHIVTLFHIVTLLLLVILTLFTRKYLQKKFKEVNQQQNQHDEIVD